MLCMTILRVFMCRYMYAQLTFFQLNLSKQHFVFAWQRLAVFFNWPTGGKGFNCEQEVGIQRLTPKQMILLNLMKYLARRPPLIIYYIYIYKARFFVIMFIITTCQGKRYYISVSYVSFFAVGERRWKVDFPSPFLKIEKTFEH